MSGADTRVRQFATWAGLTVGPVLWAVNMQSGQILPYPDCRSGLHVNLVISLLAAALSLAASIAAWRFARSDGTGLFASRLGALLSLLFAFTLLLQAMAGLLLTGCER